MLTHKRCSTCGQVKEADAFYKSTKHPSGLQYQCKQCAIKRATTLAKEHPERKNKWERDCRQKLKREVLTHYGNGKLACVHCGFDDIRALTVDHIDGGGSKHKCTLGRWGTSFLRWLRMEGFPLGYQTLCMNCQFIKIREASEYGGFYVATK